MAHNVTKKEVFEKETDKGNFYFVKKRHKFRLKVTDELVNYAKDCN